MGAKQNATPDAVTAIISSSLLELENCPKHFKRFFFFFFFPVSRVGEGTNDGSIPGIFTEICSAHFTRESPDSTAGITQTGEFCGGPVATREKRPTFVGYQGTNTTLKPTSRWGCQASLVKNKVNNARRLGCCYMPWLQ